MIKMEKRKTAILVILVAGIGDLIFASKSIRAIRNGYPDADIHLLTNSEAVPIAQNYSYVDYLWSFPIREMRKDKRYLLDIMKLVLGLRKIKFDFAVNPYTVSSWLGAIKMGFLFLLLGAKEKIGHDSKGFGLFINKKAPLETFQNRHFADAMMDIALLSGGHRAAPALIPHCVVESACRALPGYELRWRLAKQFVLQFLFADNSRIVSFSAPVLIFWILIYDMAYITIERIVTGKVKSLKEWIDYVGTDHIHHRLYSLFGDKRKAVLFIYFLCATLGISAITLRYARPIDCVLLVVQAFLITIIVSIIEYSGRNR